MEKRVCITGAAGNLGNITSIHLLEHSNYALNLMTHNKDVVKKLRESERTDIYKCDLGIKSTLEACLKGVDEVVHFAGVLFMGRPEQFLPTTNTVYFKNLVEVAKEQGVKRIILISFPHVEGPTNVDHPSTNVTNNSPISTHARTRLEEEKILLQEYPDSVILRVGMVYGNGILMPDVAKWFAKRWLLGVWKEPTQIHLISRDDFVEVVKCAIENHNASGIYNVGDDGIQTLQEYLDLACIQWNCKKPWRMPIGLIYLAAWNFELISRITGWRSPLTKDFIDIGRVSYYGDTSRMKSELMPELKYPTMNDGIEIF
ncbi:MAG: NAD(P)-dependent oxidoreductase [Bacteroidetes bacterium]|nr:NAD(P)-dependent oxidoreductase [Bacteroidota bacterium]